LAVSVKVCAGSPVPFDAEEIDRKLAAAHTLNTLAETTNAVVFDLYDHCALVMRFFIVESNGEALAVNVKGNRKVAADRRAHRMRAIASGATQVVTYGRPRGFDLVAAPLHDGERVSGLLEFVVPTEMITAKEDRLAIVARAASSALRAWQVATLAQEEAGLAAGTSFALGLRLAGALIQAGELGAAARDAVQLLARELKTPVVALRVDPADQQQLRMGPSSGLSTRHRSALEAAAESMSLDGDRGRTLRGLRAQASHVFGGAATLVDGGPVIFVAGGSQPELEACSRDLSGLLERLRVSSVASVDPLVNDGPLGPDELERVRLGDLTPRESEILALLAGGASTRQIAGRLVISEKTVKTHVQNILRKLGAASRLEAAAIAVRAGFVPLSAS
jgi:DNA-binding CsgD family transcriptional regulator